MVTDVTRVSPESPFIYLLISFGIGLWSLVTFNYAFEIADGVMRGDYYRHFYKIVIPFLNGDADFTILWTNHHSSPVLHLHQILNLFLFKGDLSVDGIMGVGFMLIIGILIGSHFYKNQSRENSNYLLFVFFAFAIGCLMPALTATKYIKWPLISIQGYIVLVCTVLAIYMDTVFREKKISPVSYLFVALGCLLLISMHNSYGSIFCAGVAALLVLVSVLERRLDYLLMALVICLVIYGWSVFQLEYLKAHTAGKRLGEASDKIISLDHIINIPSYISGFGKAISNALYGPFFASKNIRSLFGLQGAYVFWFLHGAVFIFVLLLNLWSERRVRFAAMLMSYGGMLALSVILFRGEQFPWGIQGGRFMISIKLASAGFFYVVVKELLRVKRFDLKKAAIFISLVILIAQVSSAIEHYKIRSVYVEENALRETSLLMKGLDQGNDFSLGFYITGRDRDGRYDSVIDWLSENRINVFADDYSHEELSYRYLQGWNGFQNRTGEAIDLDINGRCLKISDVGEKYAWKIKANISTIKKRKKNYLYRKGLGKPKKNLFGLINGTMNMYGIASGVETLCWSKNTVVEIERLEIVRL